MGGKKLTAKTIKRKNAPTHPNSRRAHQLNRVALRERKLAMQKSVRGKVMDVKVERLVTIVGLLDPDVTHLESLEEVHEFIKGSYLPIARDRLEEEREKRRPGRPPTKEELAVKDLVEKEKEEYRTGIEIPDLMNKTNVRILREWDGDAQALPCFRMVRISEQFPNESKLLQSGTHKALKIEEEAQAEAKMQE